MHRAVPAVEENDETAKMGVSTSGGWRERLKRLSLSLHPKLDSSFLVISPSHLPLVRYGLAVVLSVLGIGLRVLLNPEMGSDALLLLSIIAVTLSAWFGGFGPGLLATFISLVAGSIIARTIAPSSPDTTIGMVRILRLSLFLMTGVIVSALIEALSRTTTEWRRAEQEQENRVLQERNRMAREIHDTLAQGLTGIIVQLDAAEDILDDSPGDVGVKAHLTRARDLARNSLAEARRSVQALKPLSLEGHQLHDALADRIARMTAGTGVEASLTVVGTPFSLPSDCETDLLRIGMEALTNALKHARSHTVRVELVFEADQLTLSVRDDGRGFVIRPAQPGTGYGLAGMWERAERIGGRFTLSSRPNYGTEIQVTLPRPDAGIPAQIHGRRLG